MTAVFIIIFQVLWSILVGFIRLIPHGIKFGWIFVVIGIVIALFVRDATWHGRISEGMSVFLYILSVGGGIALMILKLWWNSKQEIITGDTDSKKTDVPSDYSTAGRSESSKLTSKQSFNDDVSDDYR